MKRRLLNLLTVLSLLLCATAAISRARAAAVAAPSSDASHEAMETAGTVDDAGGQGVCFSRDGRRFVTPKGLLVMPRLSPPSA